MKISVTHEIDEMKTQTVCRKNACFSRGLWFGWHERKCRRNSQKTIDTDWFQRVNEINISSAVWWRLRGEHFYLFQQQNEVEARGGILSRCINIKANATILSVWDTFHCLSENSEFPLFDNKNLLSIFQKIFKYRCLGLLEHYQWWPRSAKVSARFCPPHSPPAHPIPGSQSILLNYVELLIQNLHTF